MEVYHPTCKTCGTKTGCDCPKPKREDYDRLVRQAVDDMNAVIDKRRRFHVVPN